MAKIDLIFNEHLADMSSSDIEEMVRDYSLNSLVYDLSNLGIPQIDAAFLVDLQRMFNEGEVTQEEVDALCDEYREQGISEEVLNAIISAGWENYRDDQIESIIMDGIKASLGKTSTASAGELAAQSESIAAEITQLSQKAEIKAALEAEKAAIDDQLIAVTKYAKWNKVVTWTMIGAGVAVEGVKSRVINGMDWDDVWQDMADEVVVGVGTYATASIITLALGSVCGGVLAGPFGAVAGIVVSSLLSTYEPLHDIFEEATDWWDMLWW